MVYNQVKTVVTVNGLFAGLGIARLASIWKCPAVPFPESGRPSGHRFGQSLILEIVMRIKSALVLLLALGLVSMSGCQKKTPAADAPSTGSSSATAEAPSDAATANKPDQRFVSTGDSEKDATHVAQLVEQLRTSLAEDLASLQAKVKATESAAEKQKIYLAENPVPQFVKDSLQTIETFPKAPATLKIASSVLAHVSADQKLSLIHI